MNTLNITKLTTFISTTLVATFLLAAQGADKIKSTQQLLVDSQHLITQTKAYLKSEINTDVYKVSVDTTLNTPMFLFQTSNGPIYYSKDFTRMFHGNFYDVTNDYINLTSLANDEFIADVINEQKESVITYKAKNEAHTITIFTDTDCYYCREMHENIDDYLQAGITVNYMAYPIDEKDSAGYKMLSQSWCSDDPQQAFNKAMNGLISTEQRCDAIIDNHMRVGAKIGIEATPSMVLPTGEILEGVYPPEELIGYLNDNT